MNKTNKTIVALFLLCLIFLSIIVPAIAIMTNEFFYQTALENADIMPKNDSQTTAIRYVKGMVSNTGYFTRGQFKEIIHHITQFLKGKKASFELFISNVIINGETREGVSIFGVTGTAKTGGGGGVAKTVPVSITSRNGAMVKVVASCMGDSSTPSLYKEEHITAVSFEAVCGTLIYIKSLEFLIPSYTATGGSELVSLNNADWVFSVPETSSGGTIQITIWDDD